MIASIPEDLESFRKYLTGGMQVVIRSQLGTMVVLLSAEKCQKSLTCKSDP